MKDGNFSIHEFNEPDYSKLSQLTATEYPGKEISKEEYLQWEYKGNPDGDAEITIAERDHNALAQYIVLPRKYSVNTKIYQGSLSVNSLTHPSFRGKGLFEKLALATFSRCAAGNIEFTIGFPNPYSLPVIKQKKLFAIPGHLPLLINPLSPLTSLMYYAKGIRNKEGEEIYLDSMGNFAGPAGFSFFDPGEDDNIYREFLIALNREKPNLTYRHPEYISWRYLTIPFRKYYLFKLMEGKFMIAFAVFRARYIYGLRCGILIDFCSLRKAVDAGSMIRTIKELSKRNNLDLILTALPVRSAEYGVLKKEGFYRLPSFLMPQKLVFIVRSHSEKCPHEIFDFSRWFLTFGDYDIF